MAPTMSLEAILDRIQDLKMENDEKDEVIRIQQGQIHELETKLKETDEKDEIIRKQREEIENLEQRCIELEQKLTELTKAVNHTDALIEKLSQMLG